MKIFKITTTLTLMLMYQFSMFSQTTSDIGIFISTVNENKLKIEYRKPLNEKYNLKLGIGYGTNYSSIFSGSGDIYNATDSLIITHSKNYSESKFGLQIGLDRQIKSSPFFVGLDFIMSYKKSTYMLTERNYELNENGDWTYEYYNHSMNNDFGGGYSIDSIYGHTNVHYIIPALQLSIGVDLPLNERFLVNLSFANSMGVAVNVGESYKSDPLNELGYLKSTVLVNRSQFGIGLRYKFKS